MKRILIACAAVVLLVGALAGCAQEPAGSGAPASQGNQGTTAEEGAGVNVVCTIFPAYDWARQIVGDTPGVEVTLLLDDGVDLHSFQPTVEDIAKVSASDVFVYAGGESDEWAEDALAEAANKDMQAVNMLDAIGNAAVEEEEVEGMEPEEEDEDGEDGEEGPEYDEHTWLSLRNAQVLVDALTDALGAADPAHADAYASNAQAYSDRLAQLDAEYAQAVEAAGEDTLVFADRFPFRYLADDYGLRYYAAFSGCSAETEASFKTVVFLANKVDELGLSSVIVIDNSDGKIARTVVENTKGKDQQVLTMDSLQSSTSADAAAGKTYLSAMQDNLEVLKTALS